MPIAFVPERLTLIEAGPDQPAHWLVPHELIVTGYGTSEIRVMSAETDLASVPRVLTWLVPRYGLYTKAAVVHDSMCQGKWSGHDRFEADLFFRLAMVDLGVPLLRVWLMWTGVTWATILGKLLKRPDLTMLAVLIVSTTVLRLHPLARWGVGGLALLVSLTLLLISFICYRATNYRPLPLLKCYVWTIPGLPIGILGVLLIVPLVVFNLTELFYERRQLFRRWRTWLEPLWAVFTAAFSLALFQSGSQEARIERVRELSNDTPRARRLQQLLK